MSLGMSISCLPLFKPYPEMNTMSTSRAPSGPLPVLKPQTTSFYKTGFPNWRKILGKIPDSKFFNCLRNGFSTKRYQRCGEETGALNDGLETKAQS
jgi:hypothetical protein